MTSSAIQLQLPDGSVRKVATGTTTEAVAQEIGPGLAKAAVAGVLNGEVMETSRPLVESGEFRILTKRDNEALYVLRHSAAHLLAMAVLDLFPGTDLGFGPATEQGFYYDFKTPRPIVEDDLPRIEARMQEIVQEARPYERVGRNREQAKSHLNDIGYLLKIPHVDEIPEDEITFYESGAFTDMCEGPHVPNTSWLEHFKLLSVSGAYWRGDASGEPMQRIRGTAFFDKKSLKRYVLMLEEAKKRDHRRIGQEMDLFSFQSAGPGFPFFHPNGMVLYNELQELVREELVRRDYGEVRTPIILNDELWKRSGHWDHFKDNMYFLDIEERSYAVKPMNCPGTCLVYGNRPRSYRELPVRLAEFSPLHRNELSGTLHGLLRVRVMAQDDAHVYCTPEDLLSEIVDMIDMLQVVYPAIGFSMSDVQVMLATRPEDALGDTGSWERAEAALADALRAKDLTFQVNPGEGAFYGPKIEFQVTDALGRTWQCGTIQVDFSMPERFDLEYVGKDGARHRPVMIHRAILGSFERLIGVLIEHHAGKFPLWLAPIQAKVLSITEAQGDYARDVTQRLKEAGIRAEADVRGDKVGSKIRDATLARVPYMLIVGAREAESGNVSVRQRSGKDHGSQPVAQFIETALESIRRRSAAAL